MIATLVLLLGALRTALRGHADLMLENLALRQQFAAFSRGGRRPRIAAIDRLFWTTLRRFWSRWTDTLVFVKPETVIRWHRASFRRYWTWRSRRRRPGRPGIEPFIRDLIRRLATENPTWGTPRIHGELRMLGRSGGAAAGRRAAPPIRLARGGVAATRSTYSAFRCGRDYQRRQQGRAPPPTAVPASSAT